MTENGEKPNCRLSGFFFRWPINSTQSLSLSLKHQNPWTLKDEAEVIKHSFPLSECAAATMAPRTSSSYMSLIGTCGHYSIIEHNTVYASSSSSSSTPLAGAFTWHHQHWKRDRCSRPAATWCSLLPVDYLFTYAPTFICHESCTHMSIKRRILIMHNTLEVLVALAGATQCEVSPHFSPPLQRFQEISDFLCKPCFSPQNCTP